MFQYERLKEKKGTWLGLDIVTHMISGRGICNNIHALLGQIGLGDATSNATIVTTTLPPCLEQCLGRFLGTIGQDPRWPTWVKPYRLVNDIFSSSCLLHLLQKIGNQSSRGLAFTIASSSTIRCVGVILAHFSCSPSFTNWIYTTTKLCVALANLWQNIIIIG